VQEAEALAREALALTGSPILAVLRPVALSFLAEALVERGELAEAAQALDEPALPGLNAMFLQVMRGWVRVQRGDPERGLDELLDAGERLVTAGVTNAVPTFWRSRAALALLALDDRERAAALADEELAAARRFGAPSSTGVALRAAGLVHGDEALLAESVATLAPTAARLEHAHSLVALGAARRRAGHAADAREPLAAGLALARRCGAVALAERAYDELAATGARPRKIVRAGTDALTASERRVAEMAAAGMSNRDIAQALFVTVRTVETHLGRAYTKLDISSRTELANLLSRSA
jgi:DNA-binding CsgD family transcriptional regulator